MVDTAGRYVRTISNKGEGPGELARPEGLAVFSDRSVSFAKVGLQLFARDGFLEGSSRRGPDSVSCDATTAS
ncbi:hypothetical protein [Candidatus Palauibacter irciniicola]|uniref:hypothetical protein n=1 Tax=Candidatus Palauibacter irciniicola TaxID=3056733 RepID=UPI003B02DDB3